MFRKHNGTAKRFDPNALTFTQLQTLKQRLIAVLGEFLTANDKAAVRVAILEKIDAIQNELTVLAVKLAIA